MECLHGPKSQVVLEIKEGNGFTFHTNGFIAVASFRGISLETEEIPSSGRPKFDSSLIWEVETKYLRKLRSSNTALKVEFYSAQKNGTRDRIGYVLLNLKEAKICYSKSPIREEGSWYKLLFLKSTLHAHKPEVFMSFKIQDLLEMNRAGRDSITEEVVGGGFVGEADDAPRRRDRRGFEEGVGRDSGGAGDVTLTPDELKPIQIGPPPLCTDLYQLTISFLAIDQLIHIIPPEKLGLPFRIHFTIFGTSIFTEEISSTLKDGLMGERVSFDIWSRIEFLSAYFGEFPTLILSIFIADELIGTANLNLQVLSSLDSKKNVSINSLLSVYSVKSNEDAELGITQVYPTLHVGLDLILKSGCISTKIDQEIQTNNRPDLTYKVDAVTNTEAAEPVEVSTSRHSESPMFREDSSIKEIPVQMADLDFENLSNRSTKIAEKILRSPKPPKEPYRDRGTDHVFRGTPHTYRLSNSSVHIDQSTKDYVRDVALRACEEIEDWKERQQQMFEYELKKKTDRRLKKLSSEWFKHRKAMEEDLHKKIEECKKLKEKLTEAYDELNHRFEIVSQREKEVEIAKEELDKKYNMKFQELRKASRLCEYDMEDKVSIMKSENAALQKKVDESAKEILRLQQALLNQQSPGVSKDEINSLMNEVKSLEEKLEKALESKAFFKEQWGKAVRELHRMKEEEQQQLKLQIEKNREQLQTLGLVKEIGQEVGEMKKDQFAIKNIRTELSNFFKSSEPNHSFQCFSGT